ncbi:hypothetical protein P8452_14212 [Trifolium repens]|nr:hypothetical protein P8452_14212 [Trifolium repens]
MVDGGKVQFWSCLSFSRIDPTQFCKELIKCVKPRDCYVVLLYVEAFLPLIVAWGGMHKPIPDLENKLLLAEFSEIQTLQSSVIKAKKPSWKIGSSFALKKKVVKSSPKVQIDFDSDLIDENSLLSEEDLKKPVLPSGDCDIITTRKACKNCRQWHDSIYNIMFQFYMFIAFSFFAIHLLSN